MVCIDEYFLNFSFNTHHVMMGHGTPEAETSGALHECHPAVFSASLAIVFYIKSTRQELVSIIDCRWTTMPVMNPMIFTLTPLILKGKLELVRLSLIDIHV